MSGQKGSALAQKKRTEKLWKAMQRPLILLAVFVMMSILQPKAFPTWNNILSVLYAISIYGVMICGMIFPVLLGGIDLSIGPVAALSGAVTVVFMNGMGKTPEAALLGIALGLLAGLLCGLFNGMIVSSFAVPAFLITLSTQNIVNGLAQVTTGNNTIAAMEPKLFTVIGSGRLIGIPIPIFIMAGMMLITYIVLNKTIFGQYVYAVGGNPKASLVSGISSKKIQVICYIPSLTV